MSEAGHRSPNPEKPARQGRLTQALMGWMTRSARVATVDVLSPHFRLVGLQGDALKAVAWAAGQKVQVSMHGFAMRTYTPVSWDAAGGATKLLVFSHGEGPGSLWASGLQAGDACQFFGPRRSLQFSGLGGPVVLFGDETSFALAMALGGLPQGAGAVHLFEVTDPAESRQVAEAIGLGDAHLVVRTAADGHLAAMEAEIVRLAAGGANVVLTGKAGSIQRMSRSLKSAGIATSRIMAKAYWAPGKTGLD